MTATPSTPSPSRPWTTSSSRSSPSGWPAWSSAWCRRVSARLLRSRRSRSSAREARRHCSTTTPSTGSRRTATTAACIPTIASTSPPRRCASWGRSYPPLVLRGSTAATSSTSARSRRSAEEAPTGSGSCSTTSSSASSTAPDARAARASPSLKPAEQLDELGRALDHDVRGLAELRRPFGRRDRDAHRNVEPVEPAEGVEVGRVIARIERPPQLALLEQRPHGRSLVGGNRRPHLEHLAPELSLEPERGRAIGDATEHLECSLLVRGAPVVEDDR